MGIVKPLSPPTPSCPYPQLSSTHGGNRVIPRRRAVKVNGTLPFASVTPPLAAPVLRPTADVLVTAIVFDIGCDRHGDAFRDLPVQVTRLKVPHVMPVLPRPGIRKADVAVTGCGENIVRKIYVDHAAIVIDRGIPAWIVPPCGLGLAANPMAIGGVAVVSGRASVFRKAGGVAPVGPDNKDITTISWVVQPLPVLQ